MSEQIKSLADEIREKLRHEQAVNSPPEEVVAESVGIENSSLAVKPAAVPADAVYTEAQVSKFFQQLEAFDYSARHKSMIRVDAGTMRLLRRLKLVRGVDMNKFIVFALHQLLARHPWLTSYIQDSLKNPDL
ncbi:hypothetical protein [Pedobacter sp. GR22-6]|uniref:hypothetical protein n=1 Tax=Pedobacter sp. GR22-6 TaxID=3127957 RepID=UPI00307F8D5E